MKIKRSCWICRKEVLSDQSTKEEEVICDLCNAQIKKDIHDYYKE